MKTRFRLRTRIFFGVLVALFAMIVFVGSHKTCACGEDAPDVVLASAANHEGPAASAVDLTADTVLLKLPAEENQAPLEVTLKQLMDIYKVPGLSVAVIDNYQIAWAKGFGVTEAGGSTPVTTKTLFQAGSISKPVAATGAMWLVEHGRLS
ncbi:MAG: serine hydrolase domain-containing protein, partial [Candidatus Angelobacter sp.]